MLRVIATGMAGMFAQRVVWLHVVVPGLCLCEVLLLPPALPALDV